MKRSVGEEKGESVSIIAGEVELEGVLTIPEDPLGIIVFVHGSGSSRHSVRNRAVAEALNEEGLATLLFDLLSEEEERIDSQTTELRFNIPFLTERLLHVHDWILEAKKIRGLSIGLFGSSTGAAAALSAAASRSGEIAAVVSRGGRPDLAGNALSRVEAATLLIVGGNDGVVIDLNRKAMTQMRCERKLEIISGATHLFEEPGALEEVARLTGRWFEWHF